MGGGERLGLAGGVMLGRNVDRRESGDSPPSVWGDLLERLRSLDGLLIDLESPLSDHGAEWTDTYRPFHFRAPPEWARPALEAADVDFASLANDHALDYRVEGLRDTLGHLDRAGVATAGAGPNRQEATAPTAFPAGDLSVAVVAFTDRAPEYGASPATAGVARVAADPGDGDTRELVRAALDRASTDDPDLLVASLHVGTTMATVPRETTRAFAQWLVEEGVDLVHGHGSNLFQGVEVYDGAPICYDCGPFVNDYAVDPDLRNDRSFLFEAVADASGVDRLRMSPVEIDEGAVRTADPAAARWCRDRMRERSAKLGTADLERDDEDLVLEL